ncbi:MAG: AI-2E family transporter [Steroidobacteraceae bacterium]|jgi:predicted PurR-regulated permease PerM|nr:AI-2E family transporter [Steroidobacteraceae bacterium]
MRRDPDHLPWLAGESGLFYRRSFTLAAIALLAFLMYRILQPFVQPVAWAAIMALLLHPAQLRLARLLGGRSGLAALALTLAVLLLFVGPLSALALAFVAQAQELAEMVATMMQQLRGRGMSDLLAHPTLENLLNLLQRTTSVTAVELQGLALDSVKALLERLAGLGGSAFFGAVGTLLSFTVMMFILFFALRDGEAMALGMFAFVPLSDQRKRELAVRMALVTRAVVLGTIVTAMVQGTLLGVGFALAGLPAPVVFGVMGAVLSVVPFGGTALVWVPGAAWLLITGDIGHGVFLASWGLLLVSTADNFLKPFLIGGQAEVPTLAVFIGVLGGLAAFGLVGMFLGPVVIALVLTLLRFAADSQPPAPPTPPAS